MAALRTWIVWALVVGGSLAVLWTSASGPAIPLGVPGEWTWSRIPVDARDWPALVLGWVSASLVGAAYVGLVALAAGRLEHAGPAVMAAWLCALVAAGFAWLWIVQESPARLEFAMSKSAWVLYYPAREGYYDQARHVMRDVPSYLADYEKEMSKGDVLHLGTHPPGLMLLHRACLNVCQDVPSLRKMLLATQPDSFRAALDETARNEQGRARAVTAVDRAALWLAALVTQAFAAAAAIPIYLLVRRTHSRAVGWWTAALWPLVPALAIFLPKSDALFPFLGTLFLWLWLEGFHRGSLIRCALAGAVFWSAMFLSLAILPVGLAAALLTVWEARICSPEERTQATPAQWTARVGAALACWAVLVIVLYWAGRINLPAVWQWNLHNHAGFYDRYPRTWWKWLLVNPLELSFAVGGPIAAAAVIGFGSTVSRGWRRRAAGPCWCLAATWILLWLSGKNMGEAARLWLIIMPWVVWLAAGYFETAPRAADRPRSNRPAAAVLLLLQLVVAIGTVTRVTGFDFPNLPNGPTVSSSESLRDARTDGARADRPGATLVHPSRVAAR